MAFSTHWIINSTNPATGNNLQITIREDGYSGSTVELDPGDVFAEIRYSPIGTYSGTPHWNISGSQCRVSFGDDVTGALSEILTQSDEKYLMIIEDFDTLDFVWRGYVQPDSYQYQLYAPAISSVTATDRVSDLRNIPYSQGGGVLYSGRANLPTIVSRCLDSTNLSLDMSVHMNWYPRFSSSNLNTSDDPFVNLRMDQGEFVDDDGNPYSKFTVLEQICMRFQLQLFQAHNRWYLVQRKRNVFNNAGTDVYKVYNYESDGTADTPATSNITARFVAAVDSDSTEQLISPTVSGSVPYGSVKSTYYHKTPTDGLLLNTGFQSSIQNSSGSGTDNWRTGGTTPTATLGSPGIVSTQAVYFDSIYASSAYTSIPADPISDLNDYIEQTTSGSLVGSSTRSLQISFQLNMTPNGASFDGGGRSYIFWEVSVGSYKLYRNGFSTYSWAQSPTADAEKLYVELLPQAAVQTVNISTDALDDGGTPITGALYFRIYAPTEDNGISQRVDQVYFDNVSVTVIESSEEANTATQTLITYTGNVNREAPQTPTFITGDGPTAGHNTRLTCLNASAVEQSTTQDWSYLPVVAPSGLSIDQYWCNRMLNEFGNANRLVRSGIYSKNASEYPSPLQYLSLVNPNDTEQKDYTWQDIVWNLGSRTTLSGTFVEFQDAQIGNRICSVDVKPNTALLASIDREDGLVCDSTDVFEVPYLDYLWWASKEDGTSANPEHGIYRSGVPDDTSSVPWETDSDPFDKLLITGDSGVSDPILHVAVDRTAGYIFSCGYTGKELKRHDLDGSNETVGSSAITCWNLALDRANSHVIAYDLSSFGEYEYDLTYNRLLYTKAGSLAGCPGVDQSGTYLFLAELNVGGTTDRIRRVAINGLTATTLADFTSLGINSLDTGRCLVDENAELVFMLFPTSASSWDIYKFTYPGGTSLTSVISSVGRGMAIDRINQKVIYSDNSGDIYRCDYDGTNQEKIYDYDGILDVYAMDLGLS